MCGLPLSKNKWKYRKIRFQVVLRKTWSWKILLPCPISYWYVLFLLNRLRQQFLYGCRAFWDVNVLGPPFGVDRTCCHVPPLPLRWRHNERDVVSNHQPRDCLRRLFRRRSKKTSKLRVTGLCEGNSPVTGEFPAQRTSNAENVSIWWRHNGVKFTYPHRMICRWAADLASGYPCDVWCRMFTTFVASNDKNIIKMTFSFQSRPKIAILWYFVLSLIWKKILPKFLSFDYIPVTSCLHTV